MATGMMPKAAFVLLAATLLPIHAAQTPRHATIVDSSTANQTSYDFVIAGGGIAGLTVAARLTEDPSVKVLVVEAGPFDHNESFVRVPGLYNPVPYIYPTLVSSPQTALANQTYPVAAGRVVGGGSVVNALLWFRSGRVEYDDWQRLGGEGWSWSDLLPYFIKSETYTPANATFAKHANISYIPQVHGTKGPVQVSNPNFLYPVSSNWWEAALSLGFAPLRDLNSGNTSGISFLTTSVDPETRTRSDARLSYYNSVEQARPNYHVLANHTVSRILMQGNRTTGIEYLPSKGGHALSVSASKEVLIAAGGAHTPQLLQLSGIGPKKLLSKLGIKTVVDLPGVGTNLQDTPHFAVPYNFTNDQFPNYDTLVNNKTYAAEQSALYNSSRQGALVLVEDTSTNIAMLPLCNVTNKCNKLIKGAKAANPAASLPANTDPTVLAGYTAQRRLRLSKLASQDIVSTFIQWNTGSEVQIYFGSSLSRGSVNANSTSALDDPVVDFRSMTDPLDFQIVEAAVLKNRQIMQAPAMRPLGGHEAAPFGDGITAPDAIRKALIKVANPSLSHVCCTAPMMKKEYGGVVDADKKVYGVKGLRVIDVSSFPVLTTLPPQAAVYASAEKIADVIKKEWNLE